MEGFKEFQGKNLDDAISEACSYFDAPRERLEIDILQDSKSGIFGIVGARKAKIKARRVQLRDAVEGILGRGNTVPTAGEEDSVATAPREGRTREARSGRRAVAQEASQPERRGGRSARHLSGSAGNEGEEIPTAAPLAGEAPCVPGEKPEDARSENTMCAEECECARGTRSRRRTSRNRPSPAEETVAGPAPVLDGDASADEALSEGLAEIPFEEMDQERLSALSLEVVEHLVTPIVGRIPLKVELQEGRVNVVMECGDDSGLLIGREGQTLASLQYLASRIVSRGMGAAVRVQLDAGEYRLRQDEKLREMALALADKVRATGKSHSTRPLSSYHRRIIHMTLQDAPDVQTRSSGDGPLKRVVIQRKKG